MEDNRPYVKWEIVGIEQHIDKSVCIVLEYLTPEEKKQVSQALVLLDKAASRLQDSELNEKRESKE